MPENEPVPISEPVEEVLLKIMRPDLLASYKQEAERHRQELRTIEVARQRARAYLWRCFQGPLLERKREEVDRQASEKVNEENDRHTTWRAALNQMILGLVNPHRHDEPAA